MKRIKAFVFGKFLPFHKGHEAMINFALSQCDFLTVLVCCSDKEHIPYHVREMWIKESLSTKDRLQIECFTYKEDQLPNTSETSFEVSKIWAETFKRIFPNYSLLVTSEAYGKLVAEFMDIRHIGFDYSRTLFPVSSSAIRKDLFSNWNFLPNSVRPWYVLKVVLLGTESTGKTTLAKKLSTYFKCTMVEETARDVIVNSNAFKFHDLNHVAIAHTKRISEAIVGSTALVIIDTDIHITMSYANFVFNQKLEVNASMYDVNKANLYLYLSNDVEYFQDGTRLNKQKRDLLDIYHHQTLSNHNIKCEEIKGNWNERFEQAVERIRRLIKSKKTAYGM